MLIYESMHSLLVLYDYIGSYVIQNMVAKTGPKVAKTGTSTLLCTWNCAASQTEPFKLTTTKNNTQIVQQSHRISWN